MLDDRIRKAIAALRGAGHTVEPVPGVEDTYRIDGRDPVSGGTVLMVAMRLGLMDGPGRAR